MTTFERKLREALRRLGVEPDSTVVVAVSGGADSTALLDGLVRLRLEKRWPMKIHAAHLNHRLRGEESEADESFVRDLAARLRVEIFIERIDVSEEAARRRANLEATARDLRYDFLRRCAGRAGAEFVLTAHTRDDQAETVLMRLIRGAGTHGLRGILHDRPLGDSIRLLRPMLAISRADVIEYCRRHSLEWRTDSSNYSIDLTRNRVRLELLPLLRSFNPGIDETLAREAELMRDDAECLDALGAALVDEAQADGRLRIDILNQARPAIRRRTLRLWLQAHGGEGIDTSHILAIETLLSPGKSGRRIELPGGWIVAREFDGLVLRRASQAALAPTPLKEDEAVVFGRFTLRLFRGVEPLSININKLEESGYFVTLLTKSPSLDEIHVRERKPGDAYRPIGRRHRMKLKTLMIRHKIPVSARDNYPVLVTNDDSIVWSPGLPAAAGFTPSEGAEDKVILIVAAVRSDAADHPREIPDFDAFSERPAPIRRAL